MPEWSLAESKPPRADVYQVQVPILDAQTQEPLGIAEHWARWTGAYWCCWALSARSAERCTWRGPLAGYCWRKPALH
jgi:hypothetical protein